MKLADLTIPSTPFDLKVVEGITLTCLPMTLESYCLAQAAARHRITGLEDSIRQCAAAGLIKDNLPDLEDDVVRDGVFREYLTIELGKLHIVSWSGIVDADDQDASVTADNIERVVQNVVVGLTFYDSLMAWHSEYLRAKKDSGTVVPGISNPAAVPATAKDAGTTD